MRTIMRPLLSALGGRSRLAALSLLLAGLFACDGDVTGPEVKRIGPAGGTAVLANGAVLISVPPGALSEEVWFTVTPAFSVPASELLVEGSSWEIGPPGTTFSRRATLTISYDPGSVPDGVGEDGLGVFKVAGSDWTLMANTSASPGTNTASGEVAGLGRYGVRGLSVASVELAPASCLLEPGRSLQIIATPLASDGRPLDSRTVMWSSSDPATARVSSSGLVTALTEGTATITAASGGFVAEATVTVSIPVATVEVTPASAVLDLGETLQLSVSAKDAGGSVLTGRDVTWASSDESVATVDGSGRVNTLAVGSVTIIATVEGKSATATIGVHDLLSISTSVLSEGVVGQAYIQTLAAMGGDGIYAWSVSGGMLPAGLSLTGSTGAISGTPTASGEFPFTVKVVSAGQTATRDVSIEVFPVPVASVEVSPFSVTLTPSQTQQFTATARDAAGNLITDRTIVWASSKTSVATVTNTGLLTAKALGSTTLTATIGGYPGWAAVTVHNVLAISDTDLESAVVGMPYTHTLSAAGGDGRNTWSIFAGNLPAGLNLHASTGLISGTPTSSGISSFIVQVASSDGQTATAGMAIVVHEVLGVTTSVLEDGVVAAVYSQTLAASGGKGPYTWALSADTLPTGLSLDRTTGIISGTPLSEGSSDFAVAVTSSDNQTATRPLSISVEAVPVASVEVTPPSATATIGQTQQLTAIPRDAAGNDLTGRTVVWESSDGSVATVDSDGLVTALAVGSTTITATVSGKTDIATITVYAVLGVLTSSLADGVVGVAYNQNLAATGGNGTYTWTVTSGVLPAGLILDGATGVISGTPTAIGTENFTVEVVSGLQTATRALSITIS
jgi:uncharacterized protein YjdB